MRARGKKAGQNVTLAVSRVTNDGGKHNSKELKIAGAKSVK